MPPMKVTVQKCIDVVPQNCLVRTQLCSIHSVNALPDTAAERLVETPPASATRLSDNFVFAPSASPSATTDAKKNSFFGDLNLVRNSSRSALPIRS